MWGHTPYIHAYEKRRWCRDASVAAVARKVCACPCSSMLCVPHVFLGVHLHSQWYSCLSGTVTVNSLLCFYCGSFDNLRHFSVCMCASSRSGSARVCACTTELAVCVSVSVRYAPSQRWHIDTILHVLTTVNAASYPGSSFITLFECIMI